jgi:hypothetical protein
LPPPPVSSSLRSLPLSSLGPIAPPSVAHYPAKRPPLRNTEPPRPPPPATAEHPRRRLLRLNQDRQPTLGEHALDPEPLPGRERRRSRRISGEPAVPWVEGPNCVVLNLFSRALARSYIFNSMLHLQKLVKCVENRRKFRKMPNKFCWIRCGKYYNFCYTHIA